jgi:hypothetical protein
LSTLDPKPTSKPREIDPERAERYTWDKGSGLEILEVGTGESFNLDDLLSSAQATDADSPSTKHEGMMLYHALPVRIETPKGGVRSGPGWSHVLPADYGFIDNVPAADGDNLDCYVGPEPESNDAYVVDQLKLDGKSFDEHKVVLGCSTPESAEELYRAGHHLSDRVFGAITRFSMPMFRRWMATADLSKPCSPDVEVRPWA